MLSELERLDLPSPPVLVGYSLGADLAVHYAAERPDAVAGLVLIDGANPLPEPFITDADLARFRAMAEDPATRWEIEQAMGTARQVLLTAQDVLDLRLEMDVVRSGILDRYRKIDFPISTTTRASAPAATGPPRRSPPEPSWAGSSSAPWTTTPPPWWNWATG